MAKEKKPKDLNYYLSLKYPFELQQESDGSWFISYPDLPGCFSCGATIEKAMAMGEDAKSEWLAIGIDEGHEIPLPYNMEYYSGQFTMRIPKTLHGALTRKAERENVSMNQYCLYLLSKELQKELDAEENKKNKK